MLMLGNIIWISSAGATNWGISPETLQKLPPGTRIPPKAVAIYSPQNWSIYLYVAPDDNSENCIRDRRREVGVVGFSFSTRTVVEGFREIESGKILVRSWDAGMFNISGGDSIKLSEEWWKLQLTDTKSSYCGVVDPGEIRFLTDEPSPDFLNPDVPWPYSVVNLHDPWIPDADLQRLRAVIITDWPAQLKLTVTGPNVKVEPLEACISDDGKCKKSVRWQRPSLCPEGTKPGGKGSICARGEPGEATPNPVERPTSSADEEPREETGCCWPDRGICSNIDPEMCADMDGAPFPRGQPCSGDFQADCAKRTGACKDLSTGTCFDLQTERSCKNLYDGWYRGDNTRCPPKSDKRACCVEGDCDLKTGEECTAIVGAEFLGHETICVPGICPQPSGCCLPGGSCNNIDPSRCGLLYGEVLPQGQSCRGVDDARCAKLLGACLFGEECIPLQSKTSCFARQTEFTIEFREGQPCPTDGDMDVTADEVDKGACCVDDKCVDITTEDACGGRFLKGVTACEPDICLKGACCTDGQCEIKKKDECGPEFRQGVLACEPETCLGGCCDMGVCTENVLEADCLETDGKAFYFNGCPDQCPAGCCDPFGECKIVDSANDCVGQHETYIAGGCPKFPESCPDVMGACTMDCPTGDGLDCLMMSGKRCKSIIGSDFHPGGECLKTEPICLNCYNCLDAVGTWDFTLPDKNKILTLHDGCTSALNVVRRNSSTGEPQPASPIPETDEHGKWGCFGRKIHLEWPDGFWGNLEMDGEGEQLKLCYDEGNKRICSGRQKLSSRFKGVRHGEAVQ